MLNKLTVLKRIAFLVVIFLLFYLTWTIKFNSYEDKQSSFYMLNPAQISLAPFQVEIKDMPHVAYHPSPNKTRKTQAKTRFERIYRRFGWGAVGGGSGSGSTVEYTASVREILRSVIHEYSIKSMLDAPCGSFHWMPLLLQNITDEFIALGNDRFRYHGVDAVESIIEASKKKYSNQTDWQFSVCDFSEEKLPDGYELIFSRDALQHLPYEKIFDSLKAYSQVRGARYLLVGSYLGKVGKNSNIKIGHYFPINLAKSPFNLSRFERVYNENVTDTQPKSLILYDIPNYLSQIDFDELEAEMPD